ncbi:MAG: hypothetical protein GTO45_25220, partial [Candidatus Aminicenantes bacterium]|nr:hypothetical protein [Candidatus Aminicenantes bacterium]NIM82041.1 hypothetical protein [Candidatus Aminicenantes bacterium]NIN21425.1 hypothetical protein [Candidatus Aminicenantes bacterium]NIN45252.1 hypothetical protein [Candidatus Aminicenantes bacterium]NIN88072.1 hypothetical protein [Candidatus Aminicenantes bacterium]
MMATLSYPGVYMEEVSSGVRPIAAASTSTAAFVGRAEKGPDDEAKRITNWTQFQKYYGTFIKESYLAESVFQFFNNGGNQCYIVRVTRSDAETADVTVQNRAASPVPCVKFLAKNKGAWGNYLYLQIEDGMDDPGNTFKISIRKQEKETITADNFAEITPLEVHDNLSMDADSANYVETVLNNRSYLVDVDVLKAGVTPEERPANADVIQIGKNAVETPVTAVTEGTDGTGDLNETSYSDAFSKLDPITDFSLLAVPGIGTTIMMDEGMNYCSKRPLQDVFYIGEMSSDEDEPTDAKDFRKLLTKPNSYGAVYYP